MIFRTKQGHLHTKMQQCTGMREPDRSFIETIYTKAIKIWDVSNALDGKEDEDITTVREQRIGLLRSLNDHELSLITDKRD